MYGYQPRFISTEHQGELLQLFQTARTALARQHGCTAYDRKLWASKEFNRAHPEVSATGAYKDLCGFIDA